MAAYVYILASRSRRLYTGVTADLARRVVQHRTGGVPGHTARYRIDRLVHYEVADSIMSAIAREKQIKAWTRAKRVALIEQHNLGWLDLSGNWGAPSQGQ